MAGRRRFIALAAGVPLVALAVIGVEVFLARRGSRLPDVRLTYADAGPSTAVWLGDSTAVGTGVEDGAHTLASLVAEARDERVVMLAVSGARLSDVMVQARAVNEHAPHVVYVSLGANDVTHLTPKGAFRDGYRDLLAALPAGVPVYVLGVPDMGAPTRLAQPLRALAGARGRQLDRQARAAAGGRDRTAYVDIEGSTGDAFRSNPERFFAADRYHPSAAGYQLWADAVLATVEP